MNKKQQTRSMEQLQQELVNLQAAKEASSCHPQRYKTNDATVEKLADLLKQNPNGFLLYRDELAGWMLLMEKPGREGDREFYLESWNGDNAYSVDRIGRGSLHVTALCLSILGTIQPGKLGKLVEGSLKGGVGDDGLLQRIQLLVYPDSIEWEFVDRWPDREAQERAHELFRFTESPTPGLVGAAQGDFDDLPYVRFDPDTQRIFNRFLSRLETRLRSGEEHPAFESHLAKYRSLMPTLALLFHLMDLSAHKDAGARISSGAAEMAVEWCDFLEMHARKVYAYTVDAGIRSAHALATKTKCLLLWRSFLSATGRGWKSSLPEDGPVM